MCGYEAEWRPGGRHFVPRLGEDWALRSFAMHTLHTLGTRASEHAQPAVSLVESEELVHANVMPPEELASQSMPLTPWTVGQVWGGTALCRPQSTTCAHCSRQHCCRHGYCCRFAVYCQAMPTFYPTASP